MVLREPLDDGAGDDGGPLGQHTGVFRRAESLLDAVAGEKEEVARDQCQFGRLGDHRTLAGLARSLELRRNSETAWRPSLRV